MLDESVYEGRGAAAAATVVGDWADVPEDILGTVLGLLPCLADRASVRSVCRHWRAAARVLALPAPLPVLVLPRFIRFSCLTSDGTLTAARRALMPVEVAGDDVEIVGSFADWLMAWRFKSSRHGRETAAECFLVHAFSSKVVYLPRLQQSPFIYDRLDGSTSAHPIPRFFTGTKEQESRLLLFNAVLSASPSSGSNYIVAALSWHRGAPLSWHRGAPGLALWQPGMTSWYLCRSAQINSLSAELAFYEGKLYVVQKSIPRILALELREDEHGVSLSLAEHYKINQLIPSTIDLMKRYNLVVWRGKLLLIIRFFGDYSFMWMDCKPQSVEVFALDFSTSPCGVTQIHSFDGDCIFVQKSGCTSFSAGLHVGVQGDLIYFLDECITNTCVHNMRDGTHKLLAAGLPLPKSGVPKESYNDFLVWMFPS